MTRFLALTIPFVIGAVALFVVLKPEVFVMPLEKFPCVSYTPRRAYLDRPILAEDIRRDLELLRPYTSCIRTYFASFADRRVDWGAVPHEAQRLGLSVMLGIGVKRSPRFNRMERRVGVALAKAYSNVTHVIVGNEVLLRNWIRRRGKVPQNGLYRAISQVKRELKQPVSTAEPLGTYLGMERLARLVEFYASNELPFWIGKSFARSRDVLHQKFRDFISRVHPKEVIITEIGWPSGGERFKSAIPSFEDMVRYQRDLPNVARDLGVKLTVFEAFDQTWRVSISGQREGPWGVLSNSGTPWAYAGYYGSLMLALFILGATFLCVVLWRRLRDAQDSKGHFFAGVLLTSLLVAIVFVVRKGIFEGMYVELGLFTLLTLVTLGVSLVQSIEVGGLLGGRFRDPGLRGEATEKPFVSLHVPCRNEDPRIVVGTLEALSRLDYPRYEVIVLINNTPDEALWRPVEEFCAAHGSRFRFFNFPDLSGFKAGILNRGLDLVDPETTIVGIVDADYEVAPQWLQDNITLFADPRVGVVQAPQAHRYDPQSRYQAAIADEYEIFFHSGMIERDVDDAIIVHGTMNLFRVEALRSIGGWAEWCITEDAECGLRLAQAGWSARYVQTRYGRGLLPAHFRSYQRQRFRWAYGGMRILRAHIGSLLRGTGLSSGQRYHYLTGWFPWMSEMLHPLLLVSWGIGAGLMAMNVIPMYPVEFAFPIVVFFLIRYVSVLVVIFRQMQLPIARGAACFLAACSFSSTVGTAMWYALFSDRYPFITTNRSGARAPLPRGARMLEGYVKYRIDLLFALTILISSLLLVDHHRYSWQSIVWLLSALAIVLPVLSATLLEVAARREASGREGR